MGEIADMMLEGILCEQCGVYIDDDFDAGYPRLCPSCVEEEKKADNKPSRSTEKPAD